MGGFFLETKKPRSKMKEKAKKASRDTLSSFLYAMTKSVIVATCIGAFFCPSAVRTASDWIVRNQFELLLFIGAWLLGGSVIWMLSKIVSIERERRATPALRFVWPRAAKLLKLDILFYVTDETRQYRVVYRSRKHRLCRPTVLDMYFDDTAGCYVIADHNDGSVVAVKTDTQPGCAIGEWDKGECVHFVT